MSPLGASGFVRWLWRDGLGARVVRAPFVPVALAYDGVMRLRTLAYRRGMVRTRRLPLPTIAVGNLSVGGTGKTPVAAWIAAHCASLGKKPGILLRGYGGDEAFVHARLVPEAIVVADADRAAGARAAEARGAEVLILDDAYQLLGVERELNIAIVSAESLDESPWPLPAGPWREHWGALERADLVLVTRREAPPAAARALADRLMTERPRTPVALASLALSALEGMRTGTSVPFAALAGRRVVAACGIADPQSFRRQLEATGASVQLVAFQDHHTYRRRDVTWLARVAAGGDYVVVTEKDAVKLRARWPGSVPEPLVAALEVRWDRNGQALEGAVARLLGS